MASNIHQAYYYIKQNNIVPSRVIMVTRPENLRGICGEGKTLHLYGTYYKRSNYQDCIEMARTRGFKIETIGENMEKEKSDGLTAGYYELPPKAKELQDLISYKNMNAQMGEIGRSWYRYGESSHSDKLRDARKIKFYIEAEIKRLIDYEGF